MIIRYVLRVEPQTEVRADYALRILLEGIGVAGRRVDTVREADLVYGPGRPGDLSDRAVWVRAAGVPDWDTPDVELAWWQDLPVINAGGVAGATAVPDPHDMGQDIVYATYGFVTGAFERKQPKDAWGVPIGPKSTLSRHGTMDIAAIPLYCRALLTKLAARRRSEIPRAPMWPDGKKYAISLSHDVDAPFTREPWAFYFRRFRTNLAQRELTAAVQGLARTGKTAVATRMSRLLDPADDPNFCFDRWVEIEESVSAKSCFYVAVTTSADPLGSPIDVTYDFRHPDLVSELRDAINKGCEIGLHASANSHRIAGLITKERALLESVLGGYRVSGVRHHYWALDPEVPERTLWAHAEAGLTYDSSLGLNDAPGFRRGMMWPFQPFDRERASELPLLEIPPTLMDGSIFYRPVTEEEGGRQIEAHLSSVKELGGAAVLDWHLEQLNPARLNSAGPVLSSVLRNLVDTDDVYWATPDQLATWWRVRRELIEASAGRRGERRRAQEPTAAARACRGIDPVGSRGRGEERARFLDGRSSSRAARLGRGHRTEGVVLRRPPSEARPRGAGGCRAVAEGAGLRPGVQRAPRPGLADTRARRDVAGWDRPPARATRRARGRRRWRSARPGSAGGVVRRPRRRHSRQRRRCQCSVNPHLTCVEPGQGTGPQRSS